MPSTPRSSPDRCPSSKAPGRHARRRAAPAPARPRGVDTARDQHHQRLARELVNDVQQLQRPPIGGLIELEIERPHVVGPLCAQPLVLPSPSTRSASRSLRMICSGVCLRRFIRVPSSPIIVGARNSHKGTGPNSGGQASRAAVHDDDLLERAHCLNAPVSRRPTWASSLKQRTISATLRKTLQDTGRHQVLKLPSPRSAVSCGWPRMEWRVSSTIEICFWRRRQADNVASGPRMRQRRRLDGY
jgi:hypothetical protein